MDYNYHRKLIELDWEKKTRNMCKLCTTIYEKNIENAKYARFRDRQNCGRGWEPCDLKYYIRLRNDICLL